MFLIRGGAVGFIVSFFIDNYVKKSKKVLLFIFDFFVI